MSNVRDMTILLMAYDAYRDVWRGFLKCKNKYWPDCPYETVMVNCNIPMEKLNTQECTGINRVICAGSSTEWTERLHNALKEIKTSYVLLWLEDLFVDKQISTEQIERYVMLMKQNKDIGYIRLCRDAKYQKECELDSTLGEITEGHAYRVSTHPGIWKTDYLFTLTEKPMDAWNFEYQVGFSCDQYNYRSFITKKDALHFTNMVWRAKWTKDAVKLDKREKLELDYSYRKKHSAWSNFKTDINTVLYKIIGADIVTKLVMKRRAKGRGIPKG